MMRRGFECGKCRKQVDANAIGTRNRNHCPYCLWSKHVDVESGDRKGRCGGMMRPVGLGFKGGGELVIVWKCVRCGVVRVNRIAGDDEVEVLKKVFEERLSVEEENEVVEGLKREIRWATEEDKAEVGVQLFGKNAGVE